MSNSGAKHGGCLGGLEVFGWFPGGLFGGRSVWRKCMRKIARRKYTRGSFLGKSVGESSGREYLGT